MKPIILRPARIGDMESIKEWHREQNERDGTRYPIVPLFNANGTLSSRVPVALVGEKEGVPVQSLYVERTAELQFAGCDPTATAYARRDIDALATILYHLGYRALNCFVPVDRAQAVSKPLLKAGFHETTGEFVHFFKDLEAK